MTSACSFSSATSSAVLPSRFLLVRSAPLWWNQVERRGQGERSDVLQPLWPAVSLPAPFDEGYLMGKYRFRPFARHCPSARLQSLP